MPFPSPMQESENESEVAQSCLTLSNPTDCGLPGSSVHGIFQARVLEWGAIVFSGSFPKNPLMSSCYMTIAQWSKLRHSLVQYSDLNNRLSENFTRFSLMSYFCSGIPSHLNLLQPRQPLSLSCLPHP